MVNRLVINKLTPFSALLLSPGETALFWELVSGKLQAEVAEEFSEGEMLFALDVKPILANKCFSCHGDDPEEIEGGLDMTSLEGLLKGGESFDDVLIPGDAEFGFMMEIAFAGGSGLRDAS